MPGEGLVALGFEGLLPGAEEGLVDAERAGGLGHGVALLGDQLGGGRKPPVAVSTGGLLPPLTEGLSHFVH